MQVSVCICTWNRAALLDKTLARLKEMSIPGGVSWELLVVNNNCTDHTDEVLARHADGLPLRRIFAAQAGLSNARNAAIDAARGELILWTDDDVLVDPRWLAAYVEAIGQFPRAVFFGGPIQPWFETDPPAWILDCWDTLCNVYAVRELGDAGFAFDLDRLPYGANYAIRADVQREHRYNANLGRTHGEMMSGEETEVVKAILSAGGEGRWVPDAKVRHFIPAQRLTSSYVRSYFHGLGRGAVRTGDWSAVVVVLGEQTDESQATLWKRACISEIKYRLNRHLAPSQYWVKHLTRSGMLWGELAERRRAA